MAKTIVIAEQRDGRIKKATFELIGASAAAGNETHAILIGDKVEGIAKELGTYGASKVHVIENDALKYYTAEAYAKAALEVIKSLSPEIIMAAHTPMGRDLMPHIAAELNVGLASDCTTISFAGGLKVRHPVYAGKATAEVEFLGSGPKMITVRPNSFGAQKQDPSKSAEVIKVNISFDGLKTKVAEVIKGTSTRLDVTEASIVVSGGRAMKNADNFKILEDLADVLGAAVGASRAAVDAGFRPHRDQVGQTGKVVAPVLYVACGISGAIQHLAGMRTAKTIVAINTDPEAPIFQLADYGITEDLFKVIPLMTEEFRKIKES